MTADTADRGRVHALAIVRRACLWLLFLAPFFYLTYGFSNWLASLRAHVPDLAFSWERHIPFIAWSIVPYWSINALYGLSLFVNERLEGVDRLARRYLTVQIVAVCFFLAFPLTVTFAKPETTGIPGFMFAALGGFDRPFNQAPSLHIALLVVIWDHLRQRLRGGALIAWHVWCALIGASVLTTYQHHSIDIPTGALLGLFALWLFPADRPSPLAGFRLTTDRKAQRLGACYTAGALILVALTVIGLPRSGLWLFPLWPSLALALVALGYFGAGPGIFQKRPDGGVSLASRWLFFPYRLGAIVNITFWTRGLPASVEIAENVHLGRFPRGRETRAFATIVDMTGELVPPPHQAAGHWHSFPELDLVMPSPTAIKAAVDLVEKAQGKGPVLICCALGMQRSAMVAALWLLRTRRASSPEEAIRHIGATGRPVHLSAEAVSVMLEAVS